MNDRPLDLPGIVPPHAARIYGIALIAAPLLLLASTVAYAAEGEGINHGVLGGTIGVWSCLALLIGSVGLLRLLEHRAPRAAPILTGLALTGFAGGVGFNVEAIYRAIIGPELDQAMESAMSGSDAVAILAFLPWGWFAPLSFVLVGAFLWRTRTTAWWSGLLLVTGGVLFVSARPARIDILAMIGDGVLVLALVPIGWAMLTGARRAATRPATENATVTGAPV